MRTEEEESTLLIGTALSSEPLLYSAASAGKITVNDGRWYSCDQCLYVCPHAWDGHRPSHHAPEVLQHHPLCQQKHCHLPAHLHLLHHLWNHHHSGAIYYLPPSRVAKFNVYLF